VIDGDGSLGVYKRKCLNGSVRMIPYINITGSRGKATSSSQEYGIYMHRLSALIASII